MTPAFRIHLAAFLFLLLMVGGAGRLIYIEMSEKDFLQDQGDARTIRMERINAHRGMILDRRDNPLAVSSPVVSLWAISKASSSYRRGLGSRSRNLHSKCAALKAAILSTFDAALSPPTPMPS
jgi:cell division protein FtsI (penicillin-binding protein 3)